MGTSEVSSIDIDAMIYSEKSRLVTWPEVRMSVGYAFLSQGHRPSSANNRVHSKDNWLRQVKNFFSQFNRKITFRFS